MPNSVPPKPWLHHANHSASSLSSVGMEVAIPPSYPAQHVSSDYSKKALPPLPRGLTDSYQSNPRRDISPALLSNREVARGERRMAIVVDARDTDSLSGISKAKSSLPPTPPTPMSKSSRKVLQLTGFNPNYERTFRDEMHLYDVENTDSDSAYSQEDMPIDIANAEPLPTPTNSEKARFFLQPKVYSSSESNIRRLEHIGGPQVHSLPLRQRRKAEHHPASRLKQEAPSYNVLLAQERARLGLSDDDIVSLHKGNNFAPAEFETMAYEDLIPSPLAIQTKRHEADTTSSQWSDKSSEEEEHHRNSLFSSARVSFVLGMNELSASSRTKRVKSEAIQQAPFAGRMLPPPLSQSKRKHGSASGNHPLKSPFPSKANRMSGGEIRKRFSGAMKRISGSGTTAMETTVISNAARCADGPDTPAPETGRTGFVMKSLEEAAEVLGKGGEGLKDAVKKGVSSVKIKSKAERRRDSLRKNITFIGPSDQSPDGRVAEWV